MFSPPRISFLFCFPSHPCHPRPRPSITIDGHDDDDVVTMETELQSRRTQPEDPALFTEMTEHWPSWRREVEQQLMSTTSCTWRLPEHIDTRAQTHTNTHKQSNWGQNKSLLVEIKYIFPFFPEWGFVVEGVRGPNFVSRMPWWPPPTQCTHTYTLHINSFHS